MEEMNVYSKFKRYVARNMNLRLYDVAFTKGEGQYLFDNNGKKYLDKFSGATTAILGYNNKKIIDVYVDTCSKLHHTCSVYTPTNEVIQLAAKLVNIVSPLKDSKVIFGLSGSDAVDCSLKAARKFTKREPIFCFSGAYHGSCGLSVSATQWPSLQKGLLLDNKFYSFSYPKKEEDNEEILENLVKSASEMLPAGIIIESIQGDGGMYPANMNFLKALREICTNMNIVLILDEIQSGMGRSGKWWGYQHSSINPDLVVIGKGVTAGYSILSAVIGKPDILHSLDKGQHVFTFSASPPACAICSKVIKIIEEENYIARNEQLGSVFIGKLKNISSPLIKDVRGKGLMIGVEIDKRNNINAGLVGLMCTEKGVYCGYYGQNNEVLRIHPPYIIDEKNVDHACRVIEDTLIEIEEGSIPVNTLKKYREVCVGLGQ